MMDHLGHGATFNFHRQSEHVFGAGLDHGEQHPAWATKCRIVPFCLGNLAADYGTGTRWEARALTRRYGRIFLAKQGFSASA